MKPVKSTIEVGDVLVTDFGCTMTLPTFYKVTKRTPKTITMVCLKANTVDGDGMTGHCVPTDIEYLDTYKAHMTARVKGDSTHEYGWQAKSRLYFKHWNGQPEYFNHFD